MGINYREDKDLAFLEYCQEIDLKVLARYLTHDDMDRYVPDSPRFTSELLENQKFKEHDGKVDQHIRCWKLIAGELQHYGGDTFVNVFRGTGVLYKEILADVCDKLGIKIDKKASANQIENQLLEKFISDSWDKMSAAQREELLKSVGLDGMLRGATGLLALQAALRLGGIASYQVSTLLASSVAKLLAGQAFAITAGSGIGRGLAMLGGPIGLAIGAALTVPAFSGTAYRVTIPSVIQITYMRRRCAEKNHF